MRGHPEHCINAGAAEGTFSLPLKARCTFCGVSIDPELAWRSEDGPQAVEWACRGCAETELRNAP